MEGTGPVSPEQIPAGGSPPVRFVSKPAIVVIVVVLVLIVAGAFYWYSTHLPSGAPTPLPSQTDGTSAADTGTADIGSEIYKQASNPVANKLPDTVVPVPNPIENIYKNPFE